MSREPRASVPQRPPSAYRPDLRPLALLVVLLVVVVAGWIFLGPRILPAADRPAAGPLDGRWTTSADEPLATTLEIRDGVFRLGGDLALTGSGTAAVSGSTLTIIGPEPCGAPGTYAFELGDVDRPGLLPQFRAQTVALRAIDDTCALRRDVLAERVWLLRASLRDGIHGICDPPNEEAAVTGHWPEPSGCSAQ